MATKKAGNLYQESEAVRSRLSQKNWDTASFDVTMRLYTLGSLISKTTDLEVNRHVIVSSIASLQTFHRGTIVSIVDSGDEFKKRAAQNLSEKFSMTDALSWLSGEQVTFGELIAHGAPCNSVTDLLSWLSILLDCDIKEAIRNAVSPYERRNKAANPSKLVSNVDQFLADIAETFRLRHIFAHEAAPNVAIDSATCERLFSSILKWIEVFSAILWDTVYSNQPLTQLEMNQHAIDEVTKARKHLAASLRKAMALTRIDGSSAWLRRNHFAWMRVTKDWTRSTYGSLDGTMWPSIAGIDLAKTIQTRSEQIQNWVASQS